MYPETIDTYNKYKSQALLNNSQINVPLKIAFKGKLRYSEII